MAHITQSSYDIKANPPLPLGTQISLSHGPQPLLSLGFNMPVLLTGIPLDKDKPNQKSMLVMAHFDTGASITSIDEKIAAALNLFPIGTTPSMTASGKRDARNYIIEITFPNTELKGYKLRVSDCRLPYNGDISDLSPKNFGVLLGRDIMSNWNIVWNGPSSTVLISD
jgi:hypothetical protein